MQVISLKKHILKISLIFILLISVFLCIYTVRNYKGDNTITQNNQFKRERNSWANGGNQMPIGQNPPQNMNPPDGNIKSSFNGNGTTLGGNTQSDSSGSTTSKNQNMEPGQNGRMPHSGGNMNHPNRGFEVTNTKYSSLFTTYSIIFIILFAAAYYIFVYKSVKISWYREISLIIILLCIGLFLRISASTLMEGYSSDVNLFKNWAITAANNLSQVYSNSRASDYPPLYIYVLFLIGKIASISTMNSYFTLLLKLPSILTDITTSYIIYKLARKYLSLEISIFISAFYIFNPVTFIDSAIWGQVDSFFTFLVVLAVFLLSEKKICFSAALFSLAVLMKPQGIIFLPVLFFELVRQRSLTGFIKAAVSALITSVVVILPFSFNQNPLWIFKLFSNTISEYPYASVNGFNFFSLLGANFKNDSTTLLVLSYHSWGMIFIVIITLFSWFIYIKGKNTTFAFASALIQIVGVFTFSVGMHERYLFPAASLAILAFIYLRDKRFIMLSLGFSVTSYINIYAILFGMVKGMNSTSSSPILIVTSLANVLLFIYLVKVLLDIVIKKRTYLLT